MTEIKSKMNKNDNLPDSEKTQLVTYLFKSLAHKNWSPDDIGIAQYALPCCNKRRKSDVDMEIHFACVLSFATKEL